MIIEIPDWCKIGTWIKWYAPHIAPRDSDGWVDEKIIAFGYDGFFHQEHNCPMYFTKFSEYSKTVRLASK